METAVMASNPISIHGSGPSARSSNPRIRAAENLAAFEDDFAPPAKPIFGSMPAPTFVFSEMPALSLGPSSWDKSMENGLTFGTTNDSSQRHNASANASLPEREPSVLLPHGLAIGEEPLNVTTMGNISSSLPTGGVLGALEAGRPRAPLVIHPPSPQPPGPPLHSPRPAEKTPNALGSSADCPLEQPNSSLVEFPTAANTAAAFEALRPIGLGIPTPAHYKPAARTRGRVSSLERVPSSSLLGYSEEAPLSPDSLSAEQQAAAAAECAFSADEAAKLEASYLAGAEAAGGGGDSAEVVSDAGGGGGDAPSMLGDLLLNTHLEDPDHHSDTSANSSPRNSTHSNSPLHGSSPTHSGGTSDLNQQPQLPPAAATALGVEFANIQAASGTAAVVVEDVVNSDFFFGDEVEPENTAPALSATRRLEASAAAVDAGPGTTEAAAVPTPQGPRTVQMPTHSLAFPKPSEVAVSLDAGRGPGFGSHRLRASSSSPSPSPPLLRGTVFGSLSSTGSGGHGSQQRLRRASSGPSEDGSGSSLTGLAILASSHNSSSLSSSQAAAAAASGRRPRAASLAAGVGNGLFWSGSPGGSHLGDASPHSVGSVEDNASALEPAVVHSSSLRSGLGGAELQGRLASLSLAAQQQTSQLSRRSSEDQQTANAGVSSRNSPLESRPSVVGGVRSAIDNLQEPDELRLLDPARALRAGKGSVGVSSSSEWDELRRVERESAADRDDEPFDMEV